MAIAIEASSTRRMNITTKVMNAPSMASQRNRKNPVHDTHDDAEYQYDEKHRPLAAVCRVVRRLDGFNRVLALVEQEIERERPGQGQHDARDDKEQGGDIDRDQHQPPCDEEFAHIAAVFAVEDRERIDHVAFGQFDG